MRSRADRARYPAALMLCLFAAACGSTVPVAPGDAGAALAGQESTSGQDGLDLADDFAGVESGAGTQDVAGGGASTTAPAAGGPAQGASARAPGGPTSPSNVPRPGPGGVGGRGIDDKRIAVGLAIYEGADSFTQGLGVEGVSLGDQKGNYNVLLKHFNDRGGVAGRKIVPVYHEWKATSSATFATQEQAACARFTQDQPVFVALAGGILHSDGPYNACMHKAGTPVISSSHYAGFDEATFARFPTFSETNTMSFDAILRRWPAALHENRYFEPRGPAAPTRIGLVSSDWDRMHRVISSALKPAMRALGYTFAEEAYIRRPDRLSDAGQMSAEASNAVLRFRAEGIEHVMIFDPGRLLTLVFMTTAENQGYRPRYGLITPNGQFQVGPVPEQQFREARLMGWSPLIDVPAGEFDEPMGRAREECDRIYAKAGQRFADTNARLVGYIACDQLMALQAAFGALRGPPSQTALTPAFLSLGRSFQSAVVGPTRFAPDRHYGVGRTRIAQFFEECTCFRYTGRWHSLP